MMDDKDIEIRRLCCALEDAMIAFESIGDAGSLKEACVLAKQAVEGINFTLFGDTTKSFNFEEEY